MNESNSSKFTDRLNCSYFFNNGDKKWSNHCICSNSISEKLPLMKKLKNYFRIPYKSSSDTVDLQTRLQTLRSKRAPAQDIY